MALDPEVQIKLIEMAANMSGTMGTKRLPWLKKFRAHYRHLATTVFDAVQPLDSGQSGERQRAADADEEALTSD